MKNNNNFVENKKKKKKNAFTILRMDFYLKNASKIKLNFEQMHTRVSSRENDGERQRDEESERYNIN